MFNYDPMSALMSNLGPYVEQLQRQIQQPVNPYAAIDARIAEYMRQNGYAPVQQQQQPQQQQQIPSPLMAINAALSETLSNADMQFIANNINKVPEWLRSQEGKEFIQLANDSLKKYMGG